MKRNTLADRVTYFRSVAAAARRERFMRADPASAAKWALLARAQLMMLQLEIQRLAAAARAPRRPAGMASA